MNMESIASIGERLRKERDRLNMKQEAFAERIGITRQTQSNYEKGKRMPDAMYLAAIAEIGLDVQYILIGIPGHRKEPPSVLETARQQDFVDAVNQQNSETLTPKQSINVTVTHLPGNNQHQVAEENPDYHLNPRERALLDNYRHVADKEDRRAIERLALLAARADRDETKATGTEDEG